MPYCHKCGTKLEDDAKFCYVCGTPVGAPAVAAPPRRRERMPYFLPITILVTILIVAIVAGVIIFAPVRPVDFNQSEEAPFETGIDRLNVDLGADIARVNITFEDLSGKLVVLNVSATGAVGMLAPATPIEVTFDHNVTGGLLAVTSRVYRADRWPWLYGLNVVCDLHIDPSVNLSLDIRTSVGEIILNSGESVIFDSLNLEATTGSVRAKLSRNALLNGDVSVRSTTGAVEFSWDNAKATKNVSVNVKTTTGGVKVNVTQKDEIPANVTLNAETTTGGIDFSTTIHDEVGAQIKSTTSFGGINVNKTGFSGTKSELQSNNYPAKSNFIASLRATTGGININANYIPSSSL